jgi:hypothetical protein
MHHSFVRARVQLVLPFVRDVSVQVELVVNIACLK